MKRQLSGSQILLLVAAASGCELIYDFDEGDFNESPTGGVSGSSGSSGSSSSNRAGNGQLQTSGAGAANAASGNPSSAGVGASAGNASNPQAGAGAVSGAPYGGTHSSAAGGLSQAGGPAAGGDGGAVATTSAQAGTGVSGAGATGVLAIGGHTSAGASANGGIATTYAGSSSGGAITVVGAANVAGMAGIWPVTTGGVATGGAMATGGIPSTGIPFVPITASTKSCSGLGNICQGESCCTSIAMPGGTYPMGRSEVPGASDYYLNGDRTEVPEHSATVAAFALDKYEVTVSRFRNFVAAYNAWHVAANPVNPTSSAGLHPIAPNTGWGQSWTAAATDLPADNAALITSLKCDGSYQTWTDAVVTDAAEAYPINCVAWYQAFAFCIWDGGRLPTDAEWEYAAAGGAENRLYPWGSAAPDVTRANYAESDASPRIVVGSKLSAGAGFFGHADLGGSMYEWAFDWYQENYYGTSGAPVQCIDCANYAPYAPSTYRDVRGGSWRLNASGLRAAIRHGGEPAKGANAIGFRCARTP